MASRFLPLILCIICLLGGYQLADINTGKTTESNVKFKKMLCDKSVKTGAMVKNEYTRIEEEEAIYYEYQYYFEVGEETYSGTHRVSKELKIPIVEIFYNSDDPNNVTIHDPCIDYNKLKDRPMRYPDWIEYLGMGIILLGLGFGRSSIVRAIKGNND